MSPFSLIIVILLCVGIFYVVRLFARAKGMSLATKILLPTSLVFGIPSAFLFFTGYVELGGALAGVASTLTLVEGYLRHKAEHAAEPKPTNE